MEKVFFYILIIIIGQSFLYLEEETLILIVAVLLLDAVGGLVREFFVFELENKGNVIKNTFAWYLTSRKNLIQLLINKHNERKNLFVEIESLYSIYINQLLTNVLNQYLNELNVLNKFEINNSIINDGMDVLNSIVFNELNWLIEVVEEDKLSSDIFSHQSPIEFANEILSIDVDAE